MEAAIMGKLPGRVLKMRTMRTIQRAFTSVPFCSQFSSSGSEEMTAVTMKPITRTHLEGWEGFAGSSPSVAKFVIEEPPYYPGGAIAKAGEDLHICMEVVGGDQGQPEGFPPIQQKALKKWIG